MIRTANIDDIEKFIGAAAVFYESTGRTGFNSEAFIRSWTGVLKLGAGFILGRFDNGAVEEAVAVLLYPDPFDGSNCASTAFWYVNGNPKGLEGGLLFQTLLEELARRTVNHFYFSALHNGRYHKVVHFLEHNGFVPVETNYRKDL